MLQVPEQYAGQMMKCPLCGGTFTVPTLPPAPSAPAAGAAAAPAPPPEAPPAPPPSFNGPPPPVPPPAGYQHVRAFYAGKEFAQWLTPAAMLLVFLLLFFPWIGQVDSKLEEVSCSGWSAVFDSGLGIVFALFYLLALLVVGSMASVSFVPAAALPPAVQQCLPWRPHIIVSAVLVSFLFLVLLLIAGFGPEFKEGVYIFRCNWLRLAVFAHLIAGAGAGMEYWLFARGPYSPPPRIDITW